MLLLGNLKPHMDPLIIPLPVENALTRHENVSVVTQAVRGPHYPGTAPFPFIQPPDRPPLQVSNDEFSS